jgi:transcriptional regulator with XRE-family HTH domain
MEAKIAEKEAAIKLRKIGKSLREIEKILSIPRSTLSRWLRDVRLSENQKEKLRKKWLSALAKGRLKASQVHQERRIERINKIKQEAKEFISGFTINKPLGELIFTLFYLSEGTKRENAVVIANSNPKILKGFLNLFRYLYQPDETKFRCCLHLRKDQSEEKLKDFWSRTLNIPKYQFHKTQFDKRTNKPTFKNYKGVCVIHYFDMNLQRRILYIGEELINLLNKTQMGV